MEWIEQRRCLGQAGQQGRLGQSQVLRPLREVRLRRRFDPVGTVAVEHLVDVRVQDPALRLLASNLDRQARLRRLAAERLRRFLDVEVACELLRDRRSALHDVTRAHVRPQRSNDAGIIERAVRPEAAILDRDRRLRHPLAHVGEVDGLAVLFGRDRPEQGAVRGIDERVLPVVDRLQILEVAARHPHCGAREAGDDEHEQRDQRPAGHQMPEPLALALRAVTPLASDGREDGVGLAAATPARRGRHAKTPSARSTSWARRRSSRSSRSAAGSSSAGARTTTVASPARSPTNTSAPSFSPRRRSTIAPTS